MDSNDSKTSSKLVEELINLKITIAAGSVSPGTCPIRFTRALGWEVFQTDYKSKHFITNPPIWLKTSIICY